MKPTLKAVMLTLLATLTCGTVMAQSLRVAQGRAPVVPMRSVDAAAAVFGSNLVVDPCTSCNYDSVSGGYYVWGANNCISPGTTQWIGVRFISAASGTPRRISTSITLDPACSTTTNQVTLSLYTDACGLGPATLLVSGKATVAAAPCALTVANLRSAPALTAGTPYWVVATTNAQQNGLDAIWNASNNALIGGNVANGGWFQFSGNVGGFMVQ